MNTMTDEIMATGEQRWLVVGACALAATGACITLLRLATGRPLFEVVAIIAAVCVATGCGAFIACRSHSLRRLQRVLGEQAQQKLRFDATINNMSQGLCFFDREHRLIVCNNRYADIYGLPRDLIRPGTTLS
jgi:PAS domain-containing protein